MSNYRSHISVFLLGIALLGSVLSITHVHNRDVVPPSDDTNHNLIVNDLFCPICATIVYLVSDEPVPQAEITLQQETYALNYSSVLVSYFEDHKFGRAPPFLV